MPIYTAQLTRGHNIVTTLDGEVQTRCIYADTDKGLIKRFKYPYNIVDGEVEVEVLYGVVVVEEFL